jgi:hypothetical protein
LIMLERKVLTPEVASGRREALQKALEDVRDSNPTVSREMLPVDPGRAERAGLVLLRRVATADELAEAARLLDGRFPGIAEVLRRAGALT